MRAEGWAEEGYGAVADAFATVLAEERRGGAGVALYVGGEPVVDMWGGVADVRTGEEWGKGTAVQVFSCAKGLVGLMVHRLAQEGRLDVEAPVARYWPEFARAGKAAVTLRQVLTHRAGLPVVEERLGFEEVLAWEPVVAALERQAPMWEPGEAYAYHGMTFGWLLGEVVRRVTGRSPGAYFRELAGDPLGLEAWLGLPSAESGRVARLVGPGQPVPLPGPETLLVRTLTMNGAIPFPGIDSPHGWNAPALLAAELPAVNAVCTARGLAAVYASAATGVHGHPRLLTRETLTEALRERSSGPSWPDGLDFGVAWGSGWILHSPPAWGALGSRSFGNDGAGGSTAFGDDEYGAGFAFVTNSMVGVDDTRAARLVAAVRSCL